MVISKKLIDAVFEAAKKCREEFENKDFVKGLGDSNYYDIGYKIYTSHGKMSLTYHQTLINANLNFELDKENIIEAITTELTRPIESIHAWDFASRRLIGIQLIRLKWGSPVSNSHELIIQEVNNGE